MMDSSNRMPSSGLPMLIEKLGHPLEEIRVRSIKNIFSKLEYGLLSDCDLVYEKKLLVRLLQWFNFPQTPLKPEVLNLLLRLSKHSAAAEILVDVGAVEFLSRLRPDVDPNLQSLIDQITERLFLLPEPEPDFEVLQKCTYDVAEDLGKSRPTAVEAPNLLKSARRGSDEQRIHFEGAPTVWKTDLLPQKYFEPSIHKGYEAGYLQGQLSYFEAVHEPSSRLPSVGFRFALFPWLSLTGTDKHVLLSTDSSLQSDDPQQVVTSCNFLKDVVLQDFPAEIFVQRPQIFKTLLLLTSSRETRIQQAAVNCLQNLSVNLKARIAFHQDPAMHNCRHDSDAAMTSRNSTQESDLGSSTPLSSDSRPSAIGQSDTQPQGDGQDWDALQSPGESHSESENDLEEAEFLELQLTQLTVPEYCVDVLNQVLSLFQSSKYQIISHTAQLIHYIIDLMELSFGNIWNDSSALATKVITGLQQAFIHFGTNAKSHHLKCMAVKRKSVSTFHRLAFICLTAVICRLLKALMTPNQAAAVNIPPELTECLTLMSFDYGLATCYGSLHNILLDYIPRLNEPIYPTLCKTKDMCRSSEAACHFLLNSDRDDRQLQIAKDGLRSLEYHKNLEYVKKFVHVLSEACSQQASSEEHVNTGEAVLLQLLAHKSQAIRLATYRSSYGVVKEALSVKQVRNTMLTDSLKIQFLLKTEVLIEICNCGLADVNEQVTDSAQNIIMYLIQGRLLMTDSVWQCFWDNLRPVFPILQAFADTQSTFGRCITLFTNTETCSISSLDLLRGNLRILCASDSRLRADTIRHIVWFLTREENSPERIPDVHDLDYNKVSNIFCVEEVVNLITLTSTPPVYQADNLIRVFEILKSPEMEKSIKKSAAQQVSYMLEDPKLHHVFKENNGPEFLLSMIDAGLLKPNYLKNDEDTVELLPHYFHCLLMLAIYDDSMRGELSLNEKLYLNILRGALLLNLEVPTCLDVTHLLILLLFNEVLQKEKRIPAPGGGDYEAHFVFALPASVVKRYRFPFRVIECKDRICNSVHNSNEEESAPDPLLSSPAVDMLRVAWNVGWYGGLESLVKDNDLQHFTEFSQELQLTVTDHLVLKTTHLMTSLNSCIKDICQADSHKDVRSSLYLLRLHLVASYGHDNVESIASLSWEDGFTRFLSVIPSSKADRDLLYDILGFLMFMIDGSHAPLPSTRNWVYSAGFSIQNALFSVMASPESQLRDANNSDVKPLNRQLIKFISCIAVGLPYADDGLSSSVEGLSGQLVHSLLQNLNLGEAPHFYNLAALETVLHCLVHVTARSGCTSSCTSLAAPALCRQLLSTLMDVVAAFHIGRGGAANSFMGRGVTKSSTLCLQHLAAEMAVQMKDENWAQYWLCNQQQVNAGNGNLGLTWLVPLWTYRDPEVRGAGLGIAVNIASSTYGCNTLTVHLQQVASGVWGAALSFLLDRNEASFVKQQAALLLVNLTTQPLSVKKANDGQGIQQGPVVRDTDTQATVVGLNALLLLLHHSNFYKEMSTLVSCFYCFETMRHVPLTADASSNTTSSADHATSGSDNSTSALAVHRTVGESPERLIACIQEQDPRTVVTSRLIHHGFASSFDSVAGSSTSSTSPDFKRLMIVTPALVSAICQFLRNLVVLAPRDTVNAMLREQLLDALVKCVDVAHLLAPQRGLEKHYRRLVLDLIEMHTSIYNLITTTLSKDSKLHVTNNLYIISMAFSSLNVKILDAASVKTPVFCLWKSVYSLLSVLLQSNNCDIGLLFSSVKNNWIVFTANLKLVLEEKVMNELWLSALKCWTLLCAVEGKQKKDSTMESEKMSIVGLLETPENSQSEDIFSRRTWSSLLCQLMLQKHSAVLKRPRIDAFADRTVILNALSSLFGISNTAKVTAVEEGFMKIIVDQFKEIHNIFTMHSLDYAKKGKVKDIMIVQDLTDHLNLLRNLVCRYQDGKVEASKLGFSSIIHQLWVWCIEDAKLMNAMLSLICTYTAKCKHSNRSLSFTSPLPGSGGMKIPSTNSLVHYLLRLAQRELDRFSCTRETTQIVLIFQILTNLCFGIESRSILCKSNFLEGFCRLSPTRTKKNKHYQVTDVLWLNFFVSLSFSAEGQDAISKIRGSVDLLLDFAQSSFVASTKPALLILRNMCCSSCHWPRLLNSERLVPTMVACVQNGSSIEAPIAASALWALVANNQKAKTFLKTLSVLPCLEQTMLKYQSSPTELPSHKATMHALDNLLKACSLKE